MLKVLMRPYSDEMGESGIRRVCEAYERYLPAHGIEFVDKEDEHELFVVHAGMWTKFTPRVPVVAHLHGLYWTADYQADSWEWHANNQVVKSIRHASAITVPSEWVAETIRRDVRVSPRVLHHGIEWDEWQNPDAKNEGYVLFNKNRAADVCDPAPVGILGMMRPELDFIATFAPRDHPNNVHTTGILPHPQMKKIIQNAGVYLSTTKETFGIGTLEALASGVPVLGFAHGGNLEIVEHGVTGYLARPYDYDDLAQGLQYCISNRDILSQNARIRAKMWNWEDVIADLAALYHLTAIQLEPTVSIIIPTYNYPDKVGRAIKSALDQTCHIHEIIVVDDGSDDPAATDKAVKEASSIRSQVEVVDSDGNPKTDSDGNIVYKAVLSQDKRVKLIRQDNGGVATARNTGIEASTSKYVCCIDADDAIKPEFIEACVEALEEDNSLGIAYTGLWYIKPDGQEGLSGWPGEFDYDRQLARQNQIPTCCVFRRSMWDRLGGYRQRYAPKGAGAEDAEFWLRAGAYGFMAKKVTTAGLFDYSWLSGRVSGDRNYKEVDWTMWHPWVRDGRHPLASVATPRHISHPVRQYDQPSVSVIIPIGRGHEDEVINALDSLEAQTFRNWEVILVDDTGYTANEWGDKFRGLLMAYPYAKFIGALSDGQRGAGVARNIGVLHSRAPLLLFLDADDWLYPHALESMLMEWRNSESIVYSDYVGKTTMEPEAVGDFGDRVLYYDGDTKQVVLYHRSSQYDCERAIAQPNPNDMYIWNLITSLVPRAWHDEIGGFDEDMESWEDWDYWIRMARAGKCFVRIEDELVVYRFATGSRREAGLRDHKALIEYLSKKYEGEDIMPCTGCGGKRVSVSPTTIIRKPESKTQKEKTMNDDDFVLVEYNSPNRGQHAVVGASLDSNGRQRRYGHRGGGDRFYVHRDDIAVQPHIFKPVEIEKRIDAGLPAPPPPPVEVVPEPKPIEELALDIESIQGIEADTGPQMSDMYPTDDQNIPVVTEEYDSTAAPQTPAVPKIIDVSMLPGVTPEISEQMIEMGLDTPEKVKDAGVSGLMSIKGVGKSRAKAILAYVNDLD